MTRLGGLALRLLPLVVSIAVAVVALLCGLAMIALAGDSPVEAGQAIWDGAFGDSRQVVSTLTKMVPLTLVALGWVLAFSARRINVGLEGQILVGGSLTTIVGIELASLPHGLHLPAAVLAGAIGGALYAGIAAWLWARRGVSDLVSTLMLNFVAIQLVAWLIRGPLRESGGVLAQTDAIPASARYGEVSSNALTLDVIFLPVVALAVLLVLTRTSFGFRVRLTGANPEAARHAGVAVRRTGATVLTLSGMLAGLAGASILLAGDSDVMSDNFSAGIGFEGIAVALLARNSPIGCLPAALLFAVLENGGSLMETRVGVPSSMVLVMQGIVIVIAASTDPLIRAARDAAERRRSSGKRPVKPGVPALEKA